MKEAGLTAHFEYPTVATNVGDFPAGKYTLELNHTKNTNELEATHHLVDAPLLQRLIDFDKAMYAVIVAEKYAAYRRCHASQESVLTLEYHPELCYGPPLFQGIVVAKEDIQVSVDAERDGTDEIWHGAKLKIPEGAQLARTKVKQTRGQGLQGIVKFERIEDWDPEDKSQLKVRIDTDTGFMFVVSLSPALANRLDGQNAEEPGRREFMVAVVIGCMSALKDRYGRNQRASDESSEWNAYPPLQEIAAKLKASNVEDWDAEDFDPTAAASALEPFPTKDTDDAAGEEEDE